MPNYFINACDSCQISTNCMRTVRNFNAAENISQNNISFSSQMQHFRNTGRMPSNVSDGCISSSEFKGASTLTVDVKVKGASPNSYCNSTEGSICMSFRSCTVNDRPGDGAKVYGYSINNGSSFDITSNATCTKGGLSIKDYNVILRDNSFPSTANSNSSIITISTRVNNGGADINFTCAQGDETGKGQGETIQQTHTPDIQKDHGGGYSDKRLKHNIEPIGISGTGLKTYKFNYKHSPEKYEGVIAQDLLEKDLHHPAVSTDKNGYYMVDYNKIDVEFKHVLL